MKSFRKELWFNTPARVAFVNITTQVDACIRESGVKEGIALVNAGEKPKPENDRIEQLGRALGGKNRFEIAGEWRDDGKPGERLALKSFQKADWKERGE